MRAPRGGFGFRCPSGRREVYREVETTWIAGWRCTKCGTEQIFVAHWPARRGELSVTEMLETRMSRAHEHGKRCAGVQVIPMSKVGT